MPVVSTQHELSILAKALQRAPWVAVDTETDGLTYDSRIVGMSFGTTEGAWYVPVRHQASKYSQQRLVEILDMRGGIRTFQYILDNWPGNDPDGYHQAVDTMMELTPVNEWHEPLDTGNIANLPIEDVLEVFWPVVRDPEKVVYFHNGKFDIGMFFNEGINPRDYKCCMHDTVLLSWLINPAFRHGLKPVVKQLFGYEMLEFKTLTKPYKLYGDLAPIKDMAPYAEDDVRFLHRMFVHFKKGMDAAGPVMWKLYNELELPVLYELMFMQREGFLLNTEYLLSIDSPIKQEQGEILGEIAYIAGVEPGEVKLGSPQWLAKTFIGRLQGKFSPDPKKNKEHDYGVGMWGLRGAWKRGKSGFYSTKAELLEDWASGLVPGTSKQGIEAAKLILRWRALDALGKTFTTKLAEKADENNRVHTEFNQVGTVTGRFSSSNPNLQNIPRPKENLPQIRTAFIARPGFKIVDIDYSQLELRVLAHFSKDPLMLEIFGDGGDIHQMTADALGIERFAAKTVNFAVIYGLSHRNLARKISSTEDAAKKFMARYFRTYWGVAHYVEVIKNTVRKSGYVTTLLGRRRYLPGIQSNDWKQRGPAERRAVNTKIQGSAADIVKVAMRNTTRKFRADGTLGKDIFLLSQVHDELIWEVRDELVETAMPTIQYELENVVELRVPLVAEPAVGDNWAEAKT